MSTLYRPGRVDLRRAHRAPRAGRSSPRDPCGSPRARVVTLTLVRHSHMFIPSRTTPSYHRLITLRPTSALRAQPLSAQSAAGLQSATPYRDRLSAYSPLAPIASQNRHPLLTLCSRLLTLTHAVSSRTAVGACPSTSCSAWAYSPYCLACPPSCPMAPESMIRSVRGSFHRRRSLTRGPELCASV